MRIRKNIWLVVAIAVVVFAVAYLWMGKTPGPLSEQSVSPSPSPSSAAKAPAKKPATVADSPSAYSDLVKQYEGRRIQFDDRCQITPSSPTYKNGTSIMLDNRSDSAKVVKIGSTSHSLQGFGYKILTLSSASVPQELNVSCGSSNVGKILLQATISQ